MTGTFCQRPADGAQRLAHADLHHQHLQLPGEAALELQTMVRVDFTFTENAPTMQTKPPVPYLLWHPNFTSTYCGLMAV